MTRADIFGGCRNTLLLRNEQKSRSPILASGYLIAGSGEKVLPDDLSPRSGEIPTYTPTYLQRTLGYIANGDWPPGPRIPAIILDGLLSFTVSTAACLALGVLIGQEIAR